MKSETVEVSDGIYAYIQPDGGWYLNNTGFLVGRKGVVSIDSTSTESRTQAYVDAIAAVTSLPVLTLINTHHHTDHTYGNSMFTGATIVAHHECRKEVLAGGPPDNDGPFTDVDWGDLEVEPPFLTYDTGVTVWTGGLRCDVRHVGTPAHTTNDSIVWIPDRAVLFAGDLLFSGGTPFLLFGSISGCVEVLEQIVRPLGAVTIVPGHGPVCGPEVIEEVLGYLRFVQELARGGKDAGLSPLELARQADLGAYGEWTDSERIVGNLYRAYFELEGGNRGASMDRPGAWRDMVAFNGGRLLSCHA